MEMGLEEEFLAKVCQGGRVAIPYAVREKLGLKKGDFVRVRFRKEKAEG